MYSSANCQHMQWNGGEKLKGRKKVQECQVIEDFIMVVWAIVVKQQSRLFGIPYLPQKGSNRI